MTGTEWGREGVARRVASMTLDSLAKVRGIIDVVGQTLVARGIPCILGEYGTDTREGPARDEAELAKQAGSSKAVNLVLMGRLSHYFGMDDAVWQKAIEASVPPTFLELNKKAFELGKNA